MIELLMHVISEQKNSDTSICMYFSYGFGIKYSKKQILSLFEDTTWII